MKREIPVVDSVGEPELKAGQAVSIQRQVARGYRQFLIRRGIVNVEFKANHKKEARSASMAKFRKLTD